MSSLAPPERVWWKPLNREERVWVIVVLIVAVVLFLMMIFWMAAAEQNTPLESYRVAPADFVRQTNDFTSRYQVGMEAGLPVVRPPEGGEAYLLARTFQWTPILELKKDRTYRLLVSSQDLQHGFSLQPLNMNFQILPGYVYVITLTPTETGEFYIVCNEYCGLGHHLMVGKIKVTE